MDKMTLQDVKLNDKNVLMRVDFNVSLENGEITDDNRIVQVLPSIKYILENDGLLILMSHLGRPDGERDESLSLQPVAERLSQKIDANVIFADDCIGQPAEDAIASRAG